MSRQCAEKGCITRLSEYNPDDKCFVHTEPDKTSSFSQWIGPTYRACPDCGGFMGKQGCRDCRSVPHTEAVS